MINRLLGIEPRFIDEETGKILRRIFAGMHWPIPKGAIVVIGEVAEKNAMLDDHELCILNEFESESTTDIIRRCQELKGLFKVQNFYGDTTNFLMIEEMRNRKVNFCLSKAPFVDESDVHETYLSLIRERTSKTKKILNFGEKSTLPEMLRSLTSIPTDKSFRSDYPKIAALSYALSAMVALPYEKPFTPDPSSRYAPYDPEVGL
jgi:hypothetical protein